MTDDGPSIKGLFKNVVRWLYDAFISHSPANPSIAHSQIHPDLFQQFQFERARNAASLAKLNQYLETLGGEVEVDAPAEVDLEFFVKVTPKGGSSNGASSTGELDSPAGTPLSKHTQEFSRVVVCLKPMSTSPLSPLFLAFGLISPSEADAVDSAFIAQAGEDRAGKDTSTDLIVFLRQVLSEASTIAQSYNQTKQENNDLREELERQYGIERIDLGGESYVTSNNQQVQRECLENFRDAMEVASARDKERLSGLSVRLYHPNYLPAVNSALQDSDGTFRMRNVLMESHVGENGTVHLVAGVDELRRAMRRLDLDRASIFTRVEAYWFARSRVLADELGQMLRVERVWYNSLGSGELKDFVVWAGEMYEYVSNEGLETGLGRDFSFSIVVGSTGSDRNELSEPITYIPSSRLLTVTTECPPRMLVDFLRSEDALEASSQSLNKETDEYYEEQALELAREALGAKKLVRIMASYETGAVMTASNSRHLAIAQQEACGRLIEVGERLAGLDLSGVEIAIDDRFDVWDSGIISVPYDFHVGEVEDRIRGLLDGGRGPQRAQAVIHARNQRIFQPRRVVWGGSPHRTRQARPYHYA